MSNCRSCQAEIEWVEMESGKQMPVDAVDTPCGTCDGQGFWDDEKQLDCAVCKGTGLVRLSHFATCPTAAQHRKAKA